MILKVYKKQDSKPYAIFGGNITFEIISDNLTVYMGNEIKYFKCKYFNASSEGNIVYVYEEWED